MGRQDILKPKTTTKKMEKHLEEKRLINQIKTSFKKARD